MLFHLLGPRPNIISVVHFYFEREKREKRKTYLFRFRLASARAFANMLEVGSLMLFLNCYFFTCLICSVIFFRLNALPTLFNSRSRMEITFASIQTQQIVGARSVRAHGYKKSGAQQPTGVDDGDRRWKQMEIYNNIKNKLNENETRLTTEHKSTENRKNCTTRRPNTVRTTTFSAFRFEFLSFIFFSFAPADNYN